MTYHPSLHSPAARDRHIDRHQTSAPLAETVMAEIHARAILKTELYFAATVGGNHEAREQLRILSAITVEAHEQYMARLQ